MEFGHSQSKRYLHRRFLELALTQSSSISSRCVTGGPRAEHMDIIELIRHCAAVPSFSTFEDRLHPLIKRIVATVDVANLELVPDYNLIIRVPGQRKLPPVALAAHLDKINHFGLDFPAQIPVGQDSEALEGLLDDAVGTGICLGLMLESQRRNFPPLMLLLSEMEENISRVSNPRLLRENCLG